MKEILYVYSTPTYQSKNWYKIGMTNQESGSVRISQQDGTSNPERLEKKYEKDIFGEANLTAYEVEQKIHRYYDRLGKRVRDNREWFQVDGGVEEIKRVIESIVDNSDLHKSEIKLKPHQVEANTKMNICFNSDDKRCLLAHKPRSGKTFTTIFNIKENNYKNVVILTSYPILNFQWEEVILGFKGFSNTEIIIGSGLSKIEINPNKNSIILLSLQDVKGGEEVFEKEKFELIKDIEFDLLVLDEVHYGVETQKTQDFLNKIKYVRLLGLSATPTRNLLCGRFSKDQIHNYTLVEEVSLKKEYPDIYPYADINFLIWNLSNNEKSELNYFSDEEQFKFDKFFRIEGNDFYYKSDIIYLFKKLIGDREICRRDKLGTNYPFKNNGDFSVVKSILLFVPSIPVQYKLRELLSTLSSYDDFNIHVTNSNEYSSKDLVSKIKRDFKSGDKRSMILAVDQLTTGITLDDCDMVALMNDWRSVDKYIQASFRCQSPREGKENCWVLDFNAARSFELMWEYQNIISKNNGKTLTENISEWVECVNIFNRVEGEMIKVHFDEFNNEYTKSVLEKPRFNYQSVILQDKLDNENISKALMAVGIKGGSSSSEEKLNEEGIEKGKSKDVQRIGSENEKTAEIDKISQSKLVEIAKALVDKTMLLSIFTYFKYDSIDDCFRALEEDNTIVDGIDVLERKMYLETLLLGMNDVDKINLPIIKFIYDNIYNKEIINKKIYSFNQNVNLIYNSIRENPDIIGEMLKNVVELIDSYLKPSNTEKRLLGEVFTPLYGKPGCVEEQLNLIDESFWKRKDVKVLDPCVGIGNYPVVLVDKFMKGLVDEFPDPEERLKWILEEIIYVNEYQSKNLFIYLHLFDPERKYNLNFHKGDYLKLNIKEVFGVDRFDLICMNPPYNRSNSGIGTNSGSIYQDFISKSMYECCELVTIVPKKWTNNSMKDFRRDIVLHGISNINIIEKGDDIFGTSGVGEISIVKLSYGNNKMVVNGSVEIDTLKNKDILIDGFLFDENSISILEKIRKKSSKYLNDLYRNPQLIKTNLLPKTNKIKMGGGSIFKVRMSKGQDVNLDIDIKESELRTLSFGKYKVVFEKIYGGYINGNFSNMEILETNVLTTEGISYFEFDSRIEAVNFLIFLNTKFCRYLRLIKQYDRSFTSMVFSYIPCLDFYSEWTDDKLFDHFDLTDDEKNIILNYGKS